MLSTNQGTIARETPARYAWRRQKDRTLRAEPYCQQMCAKCVQPGCGFRIAPPDAAHFAEWRVRDSALEVKRRTRRDRHTRTVRRALVVIVVLWFVVAAGLFLASLAVALWRG